MGINVDDVITASDFISLKARIKAECERRSYNGSVASYATSAYDYTVIPTSEDAPLPEHFNKIIVPMNAIINTGRTSTQSGFLVRQLKSISDSLTTLESIDATASSSGCKASCTGLCQGTCTTGCTGCSSTCSGSCSTSCGQGCGGNCSGSCYQVCFTNCDTYCTDACTMVCQFSCEADCEGSCKGGCKTLCKGTCVGGNNINPMP